MEASSANAAGQRCSVFVVRGRTGYQVVPGVHRASIDSEVVFCNHAQTAVDVHLPVGVFNPAVLTIPDGQLGSTLVQGPAGLYEYEVQESARKNGFFAEGNSSPRIIVDP
jgi:hypothetical protein